MSQAGILSKNSHGIISVKPGARRALHCMVPPQYLRPGSSNVETKPKLFCLYLTDLDVLTWLSTNKQMRAAPPLQNVN